MVSRIQLCDNLEFSRFSAGFWRMISWENTPQEDLSFIKELLELGITTMDHADIYGGYQCESIFGEALALEPSLRDKMEIVTKCGICLKGFKDEHQDINIYDTGKEHIFTSVDNSLKKLGTDRIDVLLIHRPDPLMNADETAEAFTELKASGKVLHFGVSNFSTRQLKLLQSRLNFPLVTNQVEISPIQMDLIHDGSLDFLQQKNIIPMAWSCLAGGRIFSDMSDQMKRIRKALHEIQEETGAESIDQIVYAWVLKIPSKPVPILGTSSIERVKQAVASESIELTREQWFRIWTASKGHGVP